jgi:hypothetical protein
LVVGSLPAGGDPPTAVCVGVGLEARGSLQRD